MPHRDPDDPPRRQANTLPEHGTWANDRPPVCGGVGREGGWIRLTVTEWSDGETLEAVVRRANWPMVMVNTDEWCGFRVAVPNSAIGLAQAPLPPAETGAEMLEDRL